MSFAFCSSGAIGQKSGVNVNSSIAASGAIISEIADQAESFINCATKKNWSDSYTALNADVKSILTQAATDLGAMYLIEYDMSGFTSRAEAGVMLNVLRDSFERSLAVLKDSEVQTFMSEA